ncbi:DUF3224 domain-containing protein [Maritalea porphyrae]|uniref:DUF3224 domain-containing protein n=1 Tax=Maritalea porphyrae TaxID=880732 RepID=UPI0022AE5C1D|nr:DUF3224 domain-containing protein [Maritalea porphyrae]MCZ4273534.1 DUF3224 domain-containing protein [Maritalea porphyrae]
MRILAGEFTIAKWEEKSFLEVSGPAKANEADIVYSVSGDLKGQLSGKYLLIYQNEQTASYCGALQFTGTIGGLEGTFFLQETGTFANDIAQTAWTIIKGSGQGDFAKIVGAGSYAATDRAVNFSLEVEGI